MQAISYLRALHEHMAIYSLNTSATSQVLSWGSSQAQMQSGNATVARLMVFEGRIWRDGEQTRASPAPHGLIVCLVSNVSDGGGPASTICSPNVSRTAGSSFSSRKRA